MIVHRSRLRCTLYTENVDKNIDSSDVVHSMSDLSPKFSGVSEDSDKSTKRSQLNDLRLEEMFNINKENQRLQSLCSELHAKHREGSICVCVYSNV